MKMLASLLSLFAVVALAGGEEKEKKKFDPAGIVGKWKFTEGSKGGTKVDKKNLAADVTFTKDTVTIEGGGEKHVMKFTIDATKTPVQIDMEGTEGAATGVKAEGIISLDGETMKLAYTAKIPGMEAKRPEKFESTEANKAFLFVMKKAR
jgi:uncharacterized protein (TIGR03067 family)